LKINNGAKISNCKILTPFARTYSIESSGGAINASIYYTASQVGYDTNITNLIGTSYNIINTDI
jgi:hypothetical protein